MTKEQWLEIKKEGQNHEKTEGRRGAKEELANAVLKRIQENYMNEFSLEALANQLHINKFHMLRTFKAVTGETPLQYHNRYRCEKAKELLKQPDLSISYIAFETGFNSASHFSRVFKAVMEETPSDYRKKCNQSQGQK